MIGPEQTAITVISKSVVAREVLRTWIDPSRRILNISTRVIQTRYDMTRVLIPKVSSCPSFPQRAADDKDVSCIGQLTHFACIPPEL
jgi:hypothetical protein